MLELQGYLWRKRKVLTKLGVALSLCVACLLIVLPRTDAQGAQTMAQIHDLTGLFAPQLVSSQHFATLYPVTHS